jgi:hypothetical protein
LLWKKIKKQNFDVQGNIPVQNGIIHLIDKPLVILTSSLWESLDPSNQVPVTTNAQSSYIANIAPCPSDSELNPVSNAV